MIFNSVEFLLFLPIVFLCYWFLFRKLQWQNLFIVCASFLFYGWWDWKYLFLISFTAISSYLSGILIVRYHHLAKLTVAVNTIINLSILCIYKYFNFFVENLISALSLIGISASPHTLNLILPVGISFYTFQALSYSIDVYKQKLQPTHNIIEFFAFISFFPQLVAGPIERATNLLPQFQRVRVFDYHHAVDGTRQILWGLFKKMVIADNCALAANAVFDNYQQYGTIALIYGGVMFAFQIYGDFSGYSDIAIGTARLFGISLRRNFNYPYFSRSIPEFWRRWHISLNTWFTDYIYIPLGGSRNGHLKTIRNTLIVFLLSGLWHGANWTFVCWGLFHGMMFLPYHLLKKNTKFAEDVAEGRMLPTLREVMQILSTFCLAVIGWIIFRATSITQAADFLYRIFTQWSSEMPVVDVLTLSFIAFLLIVEWINRAQQFGLQAIGSQIPTIIRYPFYVLMALVIIYFAGNSTQFIYFQF